MTTRVLVLEDDDGLRASLRLVLEGDGYDVHEAADAERALQIVEDPGVDLMLVDLMLRGVDGFTFIRRARPGTEAPIVVISATVPVPFRSFTASSPMMRPAALSSTP